MRSARYSFALGLILLLAACDRSPRVESETIGYLGSRYRKGSIAVSRDHLRLAWVDQGEDGCRVVVDRRKGPKLATCGNPLFSPDGETLIYWAAAERGEAPVVHLFANGRKSPVGVGDQGPTGFSRTGGVWAAVAPVHRPGGANPEAAEHRVIAFDAEGVLGEHADSSPASVSPDGAHVAYLAADAGGRQSLIVDAEVQRSFAAPDPSALPALKPAKRGPNLEPATVRYLSDGSLVAVVLAGNQWTVFHGDDVWASYPGTRSSATTGIHVENPALLESAAFLGGSLATAEEAPTACWWERLAGGPEKWRVMCNGKPVDDQVCDYYWAELPIAIAHDGSSVAYVCPLTPAPRVDGRPAETRNLWVVAGGEKRGPHRFVWGIDLSADGRHDAYAAADGIDQPWFYVVDGRRYSGPWQQAFPPKLSPDGSAFVWAASREEDGPRVDLVFDGDIVARAESVVAPPVFHGDREVQWAVKRGRSVRRVIVSG